MNNYPLVSIIIPVRNESTYIERGLLSLLTQDYPADCMEVLIADGMSTDNTRQLIYDLSRSHPELNIFVLDNPSKIVPTGINLALRQAKGDIIIRMDGHTFIAPDYVSQCVEAIQRLHADNVGGKMHGIGSNFFGETVALSTSIPFGIGNGRFHYSDKEEWVDTVYMGAWQRSVFERIGLFDEELVRDQDDEFNYRLRSMDGKILLSPKIKSEYTVRGSPFALWKQYFQYGFWKIRVLQKHPRQMSLRQFVPPAFVLGLLGSVLLAFFSSFRPLSLVVPILYAMANLTVSVITSVKEGWKYMPLLPVVFSILHVSYGFGFLTGLIRFANRWGDRHGQVPHWQPTRY